MTSEPLTMKVGESRTVELAGPKGAGYGWVWRVEGAEGVVALSRSRAAAGPLVIEAVAPGAARIHLALQRSFEQGRPPLAERTLDVVVATG